MLTPKQKKRNLDLATLGVTNLVRGYLAELGFTVDKPYESGNIPDGPGWVINAKNRAGTNFNIEVAGPAYPIQWEEDTDDDND